MLKLLTTVSNKSDKDYSVNIINSEVVPNYNDITLEIVNEYRKYNQNYNFIGLEGFINAKLVVEVLNRMGDNIERSNLKRTVESIRDYDIGLSHKISFLPNKHQASDSVYYNMVMNGNWVPIESWDIWKK